MYVAGWPIPAEGEVVDGEVAAGAGRATPCSKEAQKQGDHRAIMHDGGRTWPGTPIAIVVTVGKQGPRMISWRTTRDDRHPWFGQLTIDDMKIRPADAAGGRLDSKLARSGLPIGQLRPFEGSPDLL